MDPFAIVLLVVFLGIPLVSLVVLFAFARTADFEPTGVAVRGGTLRGAIASAIAKVLVGDAKTFQLPLVVSLQKVGALGTATPLVGGATVRDIEWRIFLDGEHVSTVTEAASVPIATRQQELQLPVNAEVHLPRGLVGTWRKYRQDRRLGREVRLEVQGHVIVKHWWMTREMPVRITRHIVVGDPRPEARLRWHAEGPEPAQAARLDLRLGNPYHEEVLEGELEIAVVQERRLRRDPVVAAHKEQIRLGPDNERRWRYRVTLPGPVEGHAPEAHELGIRLRWRGERLDPLPEMGAVAADPPVEARTVRLVSGPAEGSLTATLHPVS